MERIIINENSYIDVAEADDIIAMTFSDDDTLANYWLCAEEDDKAAYLLSSMDEIESLRLRGRKYNYNQSLQFPRLYNQHYYCMQYLFFSANNAAPLGKDNAKKAQALNALSIMSLDMGAQSDGKYLTSKRAERELKSWISGGFACV